MTEPDPREPARALERLILLIVALVFVMAIEPRARADVVTEIGMGVKLPTTSLLMQEECHVATPVEFQPPRPSLLHSVTACGGDDPVFVGWPIAWERTFRDDVWTLRAGWFHLSHWFDGKSRRELHMDAAAVSVTINWSALRRNRQ